LRFSRQHGGPRPAQVEKIRELKEQVRQGQVELGEALDAAARERHTLEERLEELESSKEERVEKELQKQRGGWWKKAV